MTTMAKKTAKKSSGKTTDAPKSTTKGLRLHPELRRRWEAECRKHLADERAVAEAWMLAFVEASPAERQKVAARYNDWLNEQGGHTRPGPK